MDFFDHQDKARRNTKWLVLYFGLAVTCIVLTVYAVSLVAFHQVGKRARRGAQTEFQVWRPTLFAWTAGGTLAVIAIGSFFKIAALASGGKVVAESLGGRLVLPNTTDSHERKLLNVVEEMALASGLPVPQVYVMNNERGINAFAAGNSPSDAVVGVTRGCMELLNRDELQGVIGHEFSHILNGDMRLNLRLMGIIFGILCLTVIGRILVRTRGEKNPLPLVGLVLILIGWTGVFFGRLIQAAVSRQREFLADASAVQFTRNPAGLAGALKKIGGLAAGSRLRSPHAEEASHMFFGNGMGQPLFAAMATHPPLKQRIRTIDPSWDGNFPAVELPKVEPPPLIGKGRAKDDDFARRVLETVVIGTAASQKPVVRTQSVLPNLGKPTPLHLRYAEELRNAVPDNLRKAAREPLEATAIIYAMLLATDAKLRDRQLQELVRRVGESVANRVAAFAPDVGNLATRARLPLVELALPALRGLRPADYAQFTQALHWLIESDEQVDLFEFVLQRMVERHLAPQFEKRRPPVIQFYSIKPLVPDCAVLLSALAHTSSSDPDLVSVAFEKGSPYLRSTGATPTLLPRTQCGLTEINAALDRLAMAAPTIKKNLIEASVHTVGADGVIQEREAELLRAVCDSLDCPMPPFVEIE